MSLPQQKKSAEEIAKLRESLGILAPLPGEEDLPVAAAIPEILPAQESSDSEPFSAINKSQALAQLEEIPPNPEPKPVRSLRRSERILVNPPDPQSTPILPDSSPPASRQKQVRSLRKSEQGPLSAIHTPAPNSTLPLHRHSDDQLNRIRRQEGLVQPAPPLSLTAHPAMIVPGYLFALAGAAWFGFYDVEKRGMSVTIACVLVAFAFAALIFFKKPLSRHHAAFIAVVALFVSIFAALYYFPPLQHGT